jgi:hypothetical protein
VFVPFSFVLPGTAADLALLENEPSFTFTLSAAPTAAAQIPEPTAATLALLALLSVSPSRLRRLRAQRPIFGGPQLA